MTSWSRTVDAAIGGRFQIFFTRMGMIDKISMLVGKPVDVTNFRGVPTSLDTYSSGDPFGDASAQISFPQISGFDDFDSPEIGGWLGDYSNVDIWWIPGAASGTVTPLPPGAPSTIYTNPLTEQLGAIAPAYLYDDGGKATARRGVKVWEGFVASMGFQDSQQGTSLVVQCQGALYQADRYLEKPFYPPNPQTLESLIAAVFSHAERPHLRTRAMQILWPSGWSKVAPAYNGADDNYYAPNVKPGAKWTGYTSRDTGSWDRSLTGFVQDNISVMLTQPGSGVAVGNQWTVLQARQGDPTFSAGRTPLLVVRDRFRTPDFSIWYGADGVLCQLTRDTTQSANILYGDGTDEAGSVWRNAVIKDNGRRTDYDPLAADGQIWPYQGNSLLNKQAFASEEYVKFGTGFNQPDAVTSAKQILARDKDPGWAGTITLSVDPSLSFHRWMIQAGQTVNLKGFLGSGDVGVNLHVSQVQANPAQQTVELTVDTRYRDLLNLSQAIARTRDPLTPSKLLQVNRDSAIIEDVQAPWDYSAGSGYMPKKSLASARNMPRSTDFPYESWTLKHPPFLHPHWYVKLDADDPNPNKRWAQAVPILMSEKGTISRSQFAVYDKYGNVLKIKFHVSLYYTNSISVARMPQVDGEHSPFVPGAFTAINPATGQPWVNGEGGKFNLPGDENMIICWGNASQPAGYSPGIYADSGGPTGDQPTGLLEDDSQWTYDCTNNPNFQKQAKAGQRQPSDAITIYAMLYAEYSEPVYIQGRLFHQPQGV